MTQNNHEARLSTYRDTNPRKGGKGKTRPAVDFCTIENLSCFQTEFRWVFPYKQASRQSWTTLISDHCPSLIRGNGFSLVGSTVFMFTNVIYLFTSPGQSCPHGCT